MDAFGALKTMGSTRRSLLTGIGVGLVALAARPLVTRAADRGPPPLAPPPLAGEFREYFIVQDPPLPAPLTHFIGPDGSELNLGAFLGKVVLVNIWATWCPPCVVEMPALDRLQGALGAEGVAVVTVSQDRAGLGAVVPFFAGRQLRHLQPYSDAKGYLADALGVRGLPTSFLIDPKGFVVGLLEGPAEWDSPDAKALLRHYLPAGAKTGTAT